MGPGDGVLRTGPVSVGAELSSRRWRVGTVTVFAALLAVQTAAHEPWRDELQAWAIVRASDTLPQLLANIRYEGHPILWYAVLWPFARVTASPAALQVVAWGLASGTAWLIVTRAPFAAWVRTAIVFSYFPFFEYGTLARSYGLGMLLAVASCCVISQPPRRRRWVIGLVLGLLALTSVYGLFVSGALAVYVTTRERGLRRISPDRPSSAGMLLPWLACSLISMRMIIPPADAPYGGGLQGTRGEGVAAWANVWRALVPLPSRFGAAFWESNIFELVPRGRLLAIGASAVIAALVLIRVRRSAAASLAWVLGLAVLQAFAVLRIAGGLRHIGTISLLALAVIWLADTEPPAALGERPCSSRSRWRTWLDNTVLDRLVDVALVTLLLASVAAGIVAAANDLGAPFSGARAAAASIRRAGLDDAFIVGLPDIQAAGVATYLDRPIYYPSADRFGTYIRWDARRRPLQTSISDLALDISGRQDRTVVLVTAARLAPRSGIRLLSAHSGTITEDIWVYVVTAAG